MKVSAKSLIANALECRDNAGPFMVGGHHELAQPWINAAVMDALLALAMLERSGQRGSWRRHNAFQEGLEKLMARLPADAGMPLELQQQPELNPLAEPQPVPYTQARVAWLADRLLDSLWEPGVALEAADTLRRLAPFMAADTVAPEARHGTDTTMQPHAFVLGGKDAACLKCGRGVNATIHDMPWPGPERTETPCKPGCRYGTPDTIEGGFDLSHDGDCPARPPYTQPEGTNG